MLLKSVFLSTFIGIIGCSQVRQIDYSSYPKVDSPSIIKTYVTKWNVTTSANAIHFPDSLRVFLHSAPLDTFKYPYSPSTRFYFQILQKNHVSFWFYSVADSIWTIPITDTLTAGAYFLNFDGDSLQSGVYFFKREVGDSVQIKKFLLLR